jgi:hypothetical protein
VETIEVDQAGFHFEGHIPPAAEASIDFAAIAARLKRLRESGFRRLSP